MTADRNGSLPRDPRGAAGYYLTLGFLPIPLPRGEKDPGAKEWQKLRPKAEDLDRLFPPGVDLNVGLLLGEPSRGLVDGDLDCHEAVRAAPYLMPATDMISGRPGKPRSHYWYVVADPPPKASAKFKDPDRDFYGAGPGEDADEKVLLLELRSTGAQTVVPPSAHPSGEDYVWHAFGQPSQVSLDTLRQALCRVAAAALLARHWPAKGCRHELALALAGGLLRGGMTADKAVRFMKAVCVAARTGDIDTKLKGVGDTAERIARGEDVTGWPSVAECLRGDGKKVVAQVRIWLGLATAKAALAPKKRVRVLEPYRPFPTTALPQPIRAFVEQAAAALGVDPVFVALPALSVAASLIGNSRVIRLKRDWYEPSVVWSGIVGDSGTLKSPAVSAAVGPLYRLQRELIKRFKSDLQDYQREKEQFDARKAKAKKENRDFTEDEPEKPTVARVVTGDVTIEKLAQLLEDNPKGLLTCRDELGGWLVSFQRYKGRAGGTDLPNWLELFRAGTIQVDRKTGDRPTLFIPRAAASITGGVQPGSLARVLTPEYMDAGLGARILLAMPPRRRKEWTEAEIDPDVKGAYERLLSQLRDLQLDKGRDGDQEPFAVRLTAEAKAVWVAFYKEWARVQEAVEGELAAAYSKLEGYAARLALLHHVVSRVGELEDCQPVEPVSVQAGITLVRWFSHETQRIYVTLTESRDEHDARRLVEFIQARGGRITTRDLQNANSRKYPSKDAAEEALEALVAAGLGRWVEGELPARGGHRPRYLELLPTPDTSDTRPGEDDGDDFGPPDIRPDTCPDADGPTSGGTGVTSDAPASSDPEAHGANGQVSEVSGVGNGVEPVEDPPGAGPTVGRVSEASVGRPQGPVAAPGYLLVRDPAHLQTVRAALDESTLVGLDLETTGLDPRSGRARLLGLATERGTFLVDCTAVNPAPLFDLLAERELVAHNAAFDLGFLTRLGFVPGTVHDTMLLSRLLTAGGPDWQANGLAACCERYLGRALDKTEQRSDWSGTLNREQLDYAARDVEVLAPLYEALTEKVKGAALEQAADIETRALPAFVWLARSGVGFDRGGWDSLTREAEQAAAKLASLLDASAPPRPGALLSEGAWSWDSPQQVIAAFEAAGVKLGSTDDEALAGVDHPMAGLLRDYRAAQKRVSTYGTDWSQQVTEGGRVYASWNQLGSVAGRTSCSSPNLQQVPRDPRYRRCFIAPPGRMLVKADYSQLQLRIAAKVAGDAAMLNAYGRGEDLHTRTAQQITGKAEVTKADRQLAKAVNFGLLFGLGARGLRGYARSNYGLDLTEAEAQRYRRAFFTAYPGLERWHRRAGNSRAGECRTLAGRRRLLDDKTPYTHRLNSPVQGTEADGAKLGMALLWERRGQCPGAFPVLFGHDEIVVECDRGQTEAAAAWVKQAMLDGMTPLLDPVPVEVEVKAATTWGGD